MNLLSKIYTPLPTLTALKASEDVPKLPNIRPIHPI